MASAQRALHWFRSDLRLGDNTALLAAATAGQLAMLFVFDETLLTSRDRSASRIRFLRATLERLSEELQKRGQTLLVRTGDPRVEVPAVAGEAGVSLVTWNRDYGPYAKARDAAVVAALEGRGIESQVHKDRVVFEATEIVTQQGGAFAVYTPYRNAWWKGFERRAARPRTRLRLPPPVPGARRGKLPSESDLGVAGDPAELPRPGEAAALQRLRAFLDRHVASYETARDFPALDATSRLSPYLRFGALSIRRCIEECRKAAAKDSSKRSGAAKWLDELVWREFYHAILDIHPRVLRTSFRREYDSLKWINDEAEFAAWCEGRTGYPFVDAGMRQLRATGFMHNRARMVTASFLTKDLLVDWRWGERFFMSRLLDGDPASNNGGWQWAASTGTDAQPYFRIFNPVSQGERFDPEGEYVRRWVPELAAFGGKSAHRPWEQPLLAPDYPAPIVDHAERRKLALERFAAARESRATP